MKQFNEFILDEAGKVFQREVKEQEIVVTEQSLGFLSENTNFKIPCLAFNDKQPVSLVIKKDWAVAYLPVRELAIRAPYSIDADGSIYPAFSFKNEPVFDLKWKTPDDMWIWFCLEYPGYRASETAWLLAFDKECRCYRLPLGNLFEDGKICLGEPMAKSRSMVESFNEIYQHFQNSQWNGDIDTQKEQTRQLFRFKAANDGFVQQPPLAHWTTLSKKISPGLLNLITLCEKK